MKTGVLLFNLGGPENLEDVRPFLYNLFADPEIIRIQRPWMRQALAWFISTLRQGKSRDLYRQIGGGSPLRKITEAQGGALEKALADTGCHARVYVGMRCWKPTIDDAIAKILQDGIERLVLLPLFPQYSITTTGSCLKYFQAVDRKLGLHSRMQITEISQWFDHPLYLKMMKGMILEAMADFSRPQVNPVHLLYSAHSIPARYVEEDRDPYLRQTRECVSLINAQLGNAFPWTLAFQSKLGPVRWLEPSTKLVLHQLARAGTASVLVVPISFVSDHIETLQEIDIAYQNDAQEAGIREFRRVPSPNLHPKFIETLADLVKQSLGCKS